MAAGQLARAKFAYLELKGDKLKKIEKISYSTEMTQETFLNFMFMS